MVISKAVVSLALVLQVLTKERAEFPDHEVLVAYADRTVATAVGSSLGLPDGRLRLHVYTVYRNGSVQSGWRTPSYSDEWLDFDCQAKTVRVFQSSVYRPNADTIETRDETSAFVPVAGQPLRERQLETACGAEERLQYGNYFLFMEAYGLNDGREARSRPGPMVR